MADQNTEKYKVRLDKARQKRNGKDPMKYFIIGAGCIILVLIAVLVFKLVKGGTLPVGADIEPRTLSESTGDLAASLSEAQEETTISEEESKAKEEENEKKAVVDSYHNLGIVQVSGYLNMRESASKDAKVVGKLLGGSACEVLDESTDGWYQISSGGLTGFISSEFVLRGDAAKTAAYDSVQKMCVIDTEKLNVRSEAKPDAQVLEQVLKNERYNIKGEQDGWVQIAGGYISSDYVEIRYALNEARKLDLRTMVLNMYDNLGISNVNNYLNIREEPKEDSKIVGKMTSKSAGEILGKTDDGAWYQIKSGPVTGYVKSDYILTGEAAKEEALNVAELMAIVSTDRLNARTEPKTDAPIWTQVSNSERYIVLKQLDGWVEIELDSTSAYVATDFVDVRYALNEAIKFTPTPVVEEKVEAPAKKGTTSKGTTGKGTSNKGGVGKTPGTAAGSSKRSQIVNYAEQFLGNPYVWGGTSLTNGTDCSGFTMSVMGHFGIGLPHQSGSQAGCGKSISSSEMRPGDLLFYTNSGGSINHVSMYIGNGQVIHASNARDGIKISTWNYRTPAKIVNVIGD
ncbi:MAG: SH3 domain-containing protein [Clostridium sp.]